MGATTTATTTAEHTQRWASRCTAVGLGYVVDATARHEAPCPQNAQQPPDAEPTADGATDGLDHGEAIDAYLHSTLPLFESTFSPAPRWRCPGCGQTRRWLCCRCVSWVPPIESEPPAQLALPFRVVVLVRDQRDAATGIHAAMLASPVTVRHFHTDILQQDCHEAFDPANSFVLYPSADALTARELVQCMPPPQQEAETAAAATAAAAAPAAAPQITIVVPDTKWNNDGAVLAHPSMRDLPRVRLRWPPRHSRIWRSNARAVSGCVSTIEAIYCLLREVEHEQQQRRRPPRRAEAEAAAAAAEGSCAAHAVADEPRQAAAATAQPRSPMSDAAAVADDTAATPNAEAAASAAATAGATPAASGDASTAASGDASAEAQRTAPVPAPAEHLLLIFAMMRHLIARQAVAADAGVAGGGARPAPFEEESKAASRLRRGQKPPVEAGAG